MKINESENNLDVNNCMYMLGTVLPIAIFFGYDWPAIILDFTVVISDSVNWEETGTGVTTKDARI